MIFTEKIYLFSDVSSQESSVILTALNEEQCDILLSQGLSVFQEQGGIGGADGAFEPEGNITSPAGYDIPTFFSSTSATGEASAVAALSVLGENASTPINNDAPAAQTR